MFIIGNLLEALARVVDVLLTVYFWLILIRALISWVNPDPYNPIVQILYKLTEPVLYRIRKVLPLGFGIGIDLSPFIAFLIIIFLKTFLVRTLFQLSYYFR
ncbi:MAG TPA: YggT family protein [Candidatus Omnitrophica bacterium]|nr:YggT family protein [Candidatus Omnitrophota bacterium]